MAWNRQTEADKRSERPSVRGKSALRGACAAVLVIGGAAGTWLWLTRDKPETEQKDEPVRQRPIAVVQPAVVANSPAATKPSETRRKIANPKFAETYRDDKGILRYKVGNCRVPDSDEEMKKRAVKMKTNDGIPKFKHVAEKELATLVTIKLGSTLHGSKHYDAKFVEDFRASLNDPTPILEADSPKDRKIKEMVEDVKKDLKARMDAGEDLGEILQSERKEIARMADYRRSLQNQFREMISQGKVTMNDVDDYVTAANMMLKENGVEPLKFTPVMRKRIELELQRKKGVTE